MLKIPYRLVGQVVLVCLWAVSLALVAPVASVAPVAGQSQTPTPPEGKYFAQTGHIVAEPFLSYFDQHGGEAAFGYPITNQFQDSQTNLVVQYFQKVRMELHPENPEPYRILLGLLGQDLAVSYGLKLTPIEVTEIPSATDPNCYYFPETGHKVCNSFLTYYRDHGSVDMFGYPITEFVIENGQTVQYFQRARFEWLPGRPAGQRVQTTALGDVYYSYFNLDKSRLAPLPPTGKSNIEGDAVTALKVTITVATPFARRGVIWQTSFISVADQLGRPVSGASVALTVKYPNGIVQNYYPTATDLGGMTSQAFPATNGASMPGKLVLLTCYVTLSDGQTATSRTSYMLWY